MQSWLIVGGGLGFMFIMSSVGAATVFFFRKSVPPKLHQVAFGFAAGIMIAASVWSLILPAIEAAEEMGLIEWIPLTAGFGLGVLFLLLVDNLIPHLHPFSNPGEGSASTYRGTALLVSAITMHNILEGFAVGLAMAIASQYGGGIEMYSGALAMAIGIGIHNLPKSAAVALALRREWASSFRAFFIAAMTGVAELVFAILAVLLALQIGRAMPWLMAFVAGAMMYVVVEELIPHAHSQKHVHEGRRHSNVGTIGAMAGFLLMMVLDMTIHH